METCTLVYFIVVVQLICAFVVPSKSEESICDYKACDCHGVSAPKTRITCNFESNQEIDLHANSIPLEITELIIGNAARLRFKEGAINSSHNLRYLNITNVTDLEIGKISFDYSVDHLVLDISRTSKVVIETDSIWSNRGPVSFTLSHSKDVRIQNKSFAWIKTVLILDCAQLQLNESAFTQQRKATGEDPSSVITLEKVSVSELPKDTFLSVASEIRIRDSKIGTIEKEAFTGPRLGLVEIINSSIGTIKPGGFNEKALIDALNISNTLVENLESNSIQSGITDLSIQHSRVGNTKTKAINCTVAKVKFLSNNMEKVHSEGFSFRNWNKISIENNTFSELADTAFKSYCSAPSTQNTYTFTFSDNTMEKVGTNAFDFNCSLSSSELEIKNNTFNQPCKCDFDKWFSSAVIGSGSTIDLFRNSSFCKMSDEQAKCYKQTEGVFPVKQFIQTICVANRSDCPPKKDPEEQPRSDKINPVPISEHDRRNLILVYISIVGVCMMSSVMILCTFRWLKSSRRPNKSDLLKSKSFSRFSLLSRFFSNGMTSASSTHSISRLSIHEYAELHRQKMLEEELVISLENKATQTLPEEFNQELLKSLRDKLDDPEGSVSARLVIEHLYELIKVEERCDNNLTESSLDLDELVSDNVYDVIQPPKRLKPAGKSFKSKVSVGTRAPSLDKLLPLKFGEPLAPVSKPTICEYNDPRDLERHIYLEVPSRVQATQPYVQAQSQSIRFQPYLGNSVLCDYNEPKDTIVHIYSEVSASMVNRPLPIKPNSLLEDLEEAAASSGYSSR